jgi:protocatechuate 3,4-dioxygenase beta subunit
MQDFTEENLTAAVISRFEGTGNPRLKQILTSLVRNLHHFVREVQLTEEEWFAGIQFLTATGHKSSDTRQEFILLSDTLGVSMLVNAINHRKQAGATEATVLGPFYRDGARELPNGTDISGDTAGEPVIVSGRVVTAGGAPIAGALLDVWQTAPNGLYDTQDPDQPDMNLRGRLRTDAAGRYEFRTVKPSSYPIPEDGPVGKMLRAAGRHPYRPAHIHFIVSAEGFEPLTTHVFVAGDPYLDSDAVFGVKQSLVADFVRHDSQAEAAQHKVTAPFYTAYYEFGLKPAARP